MEDNSLLKVALEYRETGKDTVIVAGTRYLALSHEDLRVKSQLRHKLFSQYLSTI